MSDVVKVAIADSFLTSYAKLPEQAQKHTSDFLIKFRSNPTSPRIHYEKVASNLDKNVWSVRIDDTYRGIVLRQDKTGVYMLAWVDHHDKAYQWAKNKRCKVNPFTGAIQLYSVQEITEQVKVPGIFKDVSDADLLKLGVPEEQLPYVRSFTSKDDFKKSKDNLTADVYEGLSWLAEGFPVNEVLDLMAAEQDEQKPEDLREALDTANNQRFFRVLEGEDDLKAMLARPLDKWRVFLHPTQRKIVNKDYSGSTRVTGGAGTGKTVVAMHRAKKLAGTLDNHRKVLFTTFTANLAADIRENLQTICTTEELRHIEVINLDAWVSNYMRSAGYEARIEYDTKVLENMWENAIDETMADALGLPVDFYMDEWARVIVPQHAMTGVKYLRCSRNGRGVRLDRKKRQQVWKVCEVYQRQMKAAGKRDVNWAMDECRLLVVKQHQSLYPYIIVDEGQDFSQIAMELLRSIAGEPHRNDIFIVGDAHQRIYRNKTVLSKCGIQVRGRSSILRINYRTTEETRAYAFALLQGIPFDDLDGDVLSHDECQSLTHGEEPIVKSFRSANQEIDFIEEQIKELQKNNVPLQDICLTARTHNLLDNYIKALTERGFRCYELKKEKMDDRQQQGIRLATMHRVKGLEFQYVFVAGINAGIVPLKQAVEIDEAVAKNEAITAEKCLLYVALTRVQKGAFITSYGRKSEFLK